jgi:hypothetical protein
MVYREVCFRPRLRFKPRFRKRHAQASPSDGRRKRQRPTHLGHVGRATGGFARGDGNLTRWAFRSKRGVVGSGSKNLITGGHRRQDDKLLYF